MGQCLLRLKRFQWIPLLILFSSTSLFAQAPVSITTNAGDQSAGSLGAAVTTLNGSGAGALDFQLVSPDSITLTQPLPAISQTVTFQGQNVTLLAENNAQAQLLFQQNFIQNNDLMFQNTGALASGLDASVTAGNWTMSSGSRFNLNSADADDISTTGGSGVAGQNGGNASVTVGTWNVGFGSAIAGGAGGSVTDTGGSGDTGGAGGSASVSVGTLNFSGIYFQVNGGNGGSVTDLGVGTNTGGNGGSAAVFSNAISVGAFSDFSLLGGTGGNGVTSGSGGNVTVGAGTIDLFHSTLSIQGGVGGSGEAASGSGGSAYVTFGTFNGLTNSNLTVAGARGGIGVTTAGDGGDAFVSGGSVSLAGTFSNFQVRGGNGGNLGPVASGTGNGGNGGDAGVSLTTITIGSNSTFIVTGGNGGIGTSGAAPGAGGQGGNTFYNLGTFSAGVSTNFSFSSGSGGSGGVADAGGTGGSGGDGGSLAVTMGTLDLGAGSNINLFGGAGGAGGDVVSGGTGGTGGGGGNVSFAASSVTMGTGSVLGIQGGGAGYGGTAGVTGTYGAQGDSAVSIGSLNGSGYLNITGNNVSLDVASGAFAGNIGGSVALVKTSSSALTLSGNNSYSGGTSVTAGTLVVNTGGALGTGSVINNSGLQFINGASANGSVIQNSGSVSFGGSSTAGNSFLTNNSVMNFAGNSTAQNSTITNNLTLRFSNNSSAGAATITTNNLGTLFFDASSQGGTALITVNSGGTLDMTAHTGAVSVGSISGDGLFNLGANNLTDGTNNLDSVVLGNIIGTGGSLTKVGTGTLSLGGGTANSYTGGTLLAGGILELGKAGALGTGSVTVTGGKLETYGSALTFNVGGNYTQGSAGALQIGLGGAGASNSDLMNVTGTVSLNGTLNLADYGSLTAPTLGQSVTVITGASVAGRFSMVDQSFTGMRFLPLYNAGSVAVWSVIPTFLQTALTNNQKAIAGDLDKLFGDEREYVLMLSLVSQQPSSLPASFDEISPAGYTALFHAGFQTALNQSSFVSQRLEQVRNEDSNRQMFSRSYREGGVWYAANFPATLDDRTYAPKPKDGWGTFINGSGALLNITGDGNAAGYKLTSYGLTAAGMDKKISKEITLGLLAGYGHTGVDLTLVGDGKLFADGGQLGLYGAWAGGIFYANGLVGAGLNSYITQRAGYGQTTHGSTKGTQVTGSLELGCQWKQGAAAIGPWVSTQFTQLSLDGFTEQGSLAPLTIPNLSEQSLLTRVGLNGESRWKVGNILLVPSFKAAFEHEFNFTGGLIPAGLGSGDTFTVAGPAIGQNGFLLGAGLSVGFSKDLSLSLNYEGELGRTNLDSQRLQAGLSLGI